MKTYFDGLSEKELRLICEDDSGWEKLMTRLPFRLNEANYDYLLSELKYVQDVFRERAKKYTAEGNTRQYDWAAGGVDGLQQAIDLLQNFAWVTLKDQGVWPEDL